MTIEFISNTDGKTARMIINEEHLGDVPYCPTKGVDHRGTTLYLNGIDPSASDIELTAENKQDIISGYNYMLNPIHVREAIMN